MSCTQRPRRGKRALFDARFDARKQRQPSAAKAMLIYAAVKRRGAASFQMLHSRRPAASSQLHRHSLLAMMEYFHLRVHADFGGSREMIIISSTAIIRPGALKPLRFWPAHLFARRLNNAFFISYDKNQAPREKASPIGEHKPRR